MAQTIDVVEMFSRPPRVDTAAAQLTRETDRDAGDGLGRPSWSWSAYFEEKLAVRIPDEELGRIRTVGDLRDILVRSSPGHAVRRRA